MASEQIVDKVLTDTIEEKTAGAGVTAEGVLLKDGNTEQGEARVTQHVEFTEQGSTPATPAAGKKRLYPKADGKLYTLGDDGIETAVGSGGSVDLITQAAHGLTLGTPVYLSGSAFAAGKADLEDTAELVGLVSRVISVDQFEVTTGGKVTGLPATAFQSGSLPAVDTECWLSATVAGKWHTARPSTIGHVAKGVLIITRSDSGTCDGYYYNMRGDVVGQTGAEAIIALGNNTTTNVLDVSDRDGGTIEGTVEVNATTPLRARFRLPFVKNGAGVYQLSPDQAGTDAPATFAMTSAGVLQCTLPNHAGFTSASFRYGMNVGHIGATFPLSLGEGKLVPDGGAIGQFETITASKTLTLSSPRLGYVTAPAAAVLVDLPTTSIKAGYRYRLEVNGATETNYVALRSSSGAEVDRIGGAGFIEVAALQDAPTTAAHWKKVDVYERQTGTSAFQNVVAGPNAIWIATRQNGQLTLAFQQSAMCTKDGTNGGITFSIPSRFGSSINTYMVVRGTMNNLASDVGVRVTTTGMFEMALGGANGGIGNIPANTATCGFFGVFYFSYV